MCRILDREGELALQARVAHAVAAGELDSLADGKVIVHAYQTVGARMGISKGDNGPMVITYVSTTLRSLCFSWTGVETARWREGLKKLDRMPPVLRRAASLTDCVLVSGVGGAGDLIVPVRRTDGLAGVDAFGSRTEGFLSLISQATCTSGDSSNLDRIGTSALRTDADPEPDNGV